MKIDSCYNRFGILRTSSVYHLVVIFFYFFLPFIQAYQRLQIQQQMMQAQRNVSGPIRQQEQQVSQQMHLHSS